MGEGQDHRAVGEVVKVVPGFRGGQSPPVEGPCFRASFRAQRGLEVSKTADGCRMECGGYSARQGPRGKFNTPWALEQGRRLTFVSQGSCWGPNHRRKRSLRGCRKPIARLSPSRPGHAHHPQGSPLPLLPSSLNKVHLTIYTCPPYRLYPSTFKKYSLF